MFEGDGLQRRSLFLPPTLQIPTIQSVDLQIVETSQKLLTILMTVYLQSLNVLRSLFFAYF